MPRRRKDSGYVQLPIVIADDETRQLADTLAREYAGMKPGPEREELGRRLKGILYLGQARDEQSG